MSPRRIGRGGSCASSTDVCFRLSTSVRARAKFESGALDGLVVDRLAAGCVPTTGPPRRGGASGGHPRIGWTVPLAWSRACLHGEIGRRRSSASRAWVAGLGVPLGFLGVLEHSLELHTLALKLVQPVLELHVLRFQQAGSLVHDVLGEAQTAGNGHGVAPSGHAHRQVVRWSERVRFEIDAGVHHARRGLGVGGNRPVVRGDNCLYVLRGEVVQDGLREGRTLFRVGARAQLVEEHEGACRGVVEYLDDVEHVRAERGHRACYALLVSNIGVDAVEYGEDAPVFGRDVEAGLVHEGEQPDGLHRDGLAAGVRARDDEDGRLRSDAHGYRYGVVS